MAIAIVGNRRFAAPSRARQIGIVLVGIVAVLALAVWAASILLRPHPPSPESLTKAMRAQAALTGGAKVYATYCAYCHDTGFGPSLAHLGLPPAVVASFVRHGPAMMPAFPTSLVSDADIVDVTTYINGLPPEGKTSP